MARRTHLAAFAHLVVVALKCLGYSYRRSANLFAAEVDLISMTGLSGQMRNANGHGLPCLYPFACLSAAVRTLSKIEVSHVSRHHHREPQETLQLR